MRIKDAIANIHKSHEKDAFHTLYTEWGEKLDREHVWQEYPRPQMQRDNYRMLHGAWDYAITPMKDSYEFESQGKILVPFSPESTLSGVGRQLQPNEYLWYQRELSFSEDELTRKTNGQRCLLHFDAVDQQAVVYMNGQQVASHYGGYLPFQIDMTEFVSQEPVLLQVRVRDESDTSYHTRGKQTLKRGGMFYTAQSGIWQSVWHEWVPENFVATYKITPNYDNAFVKIELGSAKRFDNLSVTVDDADITYEVMTEHGESGCKTEITIQFENGEFKEWCPENPHLYTLTLRADEDSFSSYFGMRQFSVEKDEKGIPRFCLNHKPYFLNGVLDQGYWPDGLLAAPCDEAFVFDIELVKIK